MDEKLMTLSEIAESMHVSRTVALSMLERSGLEPILINRGVQRQHRRWLKSAIFELFRSLHRQAQGKTRKRSKNAKYAEISVSQLSADDLHRLTQTATMQ